MPKKPKTRKPAKSQPEYVYATRVNLVGLYSKPLRCRWYPDLEMWCSYDGDFGVSALGLSSNGDGGYYNFASESKQDVQNFILGAQSTMTLLSDFCTRLPKNAVTVVSY